MTTNFIHDIQDIVFVFEMLGTIAFAVSGAVLGLKKNMDIFGICILGITTGVGGGIIRDLIVGINPPNTFRDPTYIMVCIAVSLFIFLPPVRKWIFSDPRFYDEMMLLMDSIGLGIFTVSGIDVAYEATSIHGVVLLSTVGVITGVGGGVLRDIMAGVRPYVFVKHIYAMASLLGALICISLWDLMGKDLAMFLGAFTVIVIRILAAEFRLSLPKADIDELRTIAKGAGDDKAGKDEDEGLLD